MNKDFRSENWRSYLPIPICEAHPEYNEFYKLAWELARDHVKEIPGMPQTPYMDEAFCDTQVWIWDTCFMTLFCKFAGEVFPGVETFRNFYHVLDGEGILPAVIATDKEPFWTGAIPGQPKNIDVHIADNPTLFAWAEYENALFHGDIEYLKELLYNKKSLQRHYEWVENLTESVHLPGVRLQTYRKNRGEGFLWEGGASGMDNTPRGRLGERADAERPNNPDMLWLDAICQQALSALSISRLFALVGDTAEAEAWQTIFNEKKQLVNKLYWCDEDSFYYDIDQKDRHFYKVATIASYWAMTAEIADQKQAQALVDRLKSPADFGGCVPFASLSRSDADFKADGEYWRGGVWLPTAYATLRGLSKYGFHKEARETAEKLLSHMYLTYTSYEPHTIWECYSPTEYAPALVANRSEISRPDFCGWSALGPISVYIEYVLGFYGINAFENLVEWSLPENRTGKIGIKNLRFGRVVTDIVADEKGVSVTSNEPYTLKINGKNYQVLKGETYIAFEK